jgi:lipoprotein-releasing system permease protein
LDRLIAIWNGLEALGSSLSVIFIVAIAVTLALLAVVYLVAAALVVLRFARAADRVWVQAVAGAAFCLGLSVVWLAIVQPELGVASWGERLAGAARCLAWLLPACAVAMAIFHRALRSKRRLAVPGALIVAVGVGMFGMAARTPPGEPPLPGHVLAGGVAGLLLCLLPLAAAGIVEMRRSAEWFIAIRYLVAERRQVFISVITLICIGAVAAGVWLIITVLSVMNGFERTWRDEIVDNYAHFLVRSYYGHVVDHADLIDEIIAVEGVVAVAPFLDADGMVRVGSGSIAPVRLRGIEPASAIRVTNLAEKLVEGDLALPDGRGSGEVPGLVIGSALSEKVGVGVGDEVILISPHGGAPTPLGPAPRLMRFQITGLFTSSFLQFDQLYAYASLPAVQSFLNVPDVIGGFEVRTSDFYRSRVVADGVEDALGHPFYARDWKELFPQFFHALKDNRSLMFMLLIMIMVVSAFVIVVTLMMMIMAKSTDIAILKTMGATDESIELVFALEGTLIGFAGVAIGVLSGAAVSRQLAWIQARIEDVTGIDTLPASVYQISTLPSDLDGLQVLGVVSIALVLSLGATLLPSRHGARLDPVEALREE